MKKLLVCAAMIGLFSACDKDDDSSSQAPIYQPPAGVANITLTTTGGTEFKLNGPCGWAYAGGVGYIGANQENDPLKTFSIETNLAALPTQTTTYTITDDALDEDPTKVTMHFVKFSGSSYTSFDGYSASGTVEFVVNGNEVTVDLFDISLEADESNAAPYNQNGTLSGTLKCYR